MPRSGGPGTDPVTTRAGEENFPVAPWFLPAASRRHLLAFYGFARLVDDVGDEYAGDRTAALRELDRDLDRVYRGRPVHPLLRALQRSVHDLALPEAPLRALVEANRQDQRVTRYGTFADLLAYCALSANPVGHLVLYAFGAATPDRLRLSDQVCSALQVIEHLQDVAEDRARGRVYLPQEDLVRYGCEEADLDRPSADARVRALVAFQARRAASLLDAGAPLVGTLRGRRSLAVAGYVAGGRAALAALARVRYDVLGHRARPTRRGLLRALVGTWGRKG
ncbi:MAG TPA: squalene synthase HpnC [Thermomonospora sp.]|nr:squalene synthase HpnC [Thermomonospora sp.]